LGGRRILHQKRQKAAMVSGQSLLLEDAFEPFENDVKTKH